MKNTPIIIGIVAILFAAGGFFGGIKYQQTKTPQFTRGQFGNTNGQARNRAGSGVVNGTIHSVDATTMTVKLPDNSSKIVILSGTTTFAKSAQGAITDLTVGERVNAFGTTNADGSITAQSIQINPPQGQSR
jgi:hypothetical protein